MDSLGVNMKRRNHAKRGKKAIKVVYISSPMKVKASASEFRALVQQLTGKDSDATRFMDFNGGDQMCGEVILPQGGGIVDDTQEEPVFPFMRSYQEPSTSSDSIFESFDDELLPSFEKGGLMSMLQPSFFHESSQLHVA